MLKSEDTSFSRDPDLQWTSQSMYFVKSQAHAQARYERSLLWLMSLKV